MECHRPVNSQTWPAQYALLVLLLAAAVWGLTGVKAVFVRAWEDLILLACGLYGAAVLARGLFPAAFRRRDF